MFWKISNKTLAKIAAYGAVAVVSTGVYMQTKIRDRIKNADYYKDALKILRSHKGAVHLLGEPIKDGNFDLTKPEKNFCDGHLANFEVPVKGPKGKGYMFFWANRESTKEKWDVVRVELQLKNDPTKRLVVKAKKKHVYEIESPQIDSEGSQDPNGFIAERKIS